MSIPKEPRQLMVNLMYLVLTCMLALNVSAEVLQAFFSMDKSLGESNRLVEGSNQQLVQAIGDQAAAYAQFQPYKEKAAQAQAISTEFYDYVDKMREALLAEAGGPGPDGLPLRKADKDIPTRLFLNEGGGERLQKKVEETREKLLLLVDEPAARNELSERIPLKINELPKDTDKKSWAQFTFQQMPVAAVLPTLTKFQNDAKVAETAILNHFASKMNITVKPDKFAPVIAADKSYVIRGEEFKGEIFLAAYSSTADNITVSVDGKPLPVRDGKAVFVANPNTVGTKEHEMSIRLTNPLTGEAEVYRKQFSYEVGDRSVTVSADQMNVMYIGVENPVTVVAAGIPSGQMKVSADGVTLKPNGNGKFIATPQRIGKATVTVSGGGLKPTSFEYRVKRIPDPVMMMSRYKGGRISVGEFIAQTGIYPLLEGFDFNAKCDVQGFNVVRVRKGDAVEAMNRTGRFGTEARRLIDDAKRGDIFYFEKIRVKCPGDEIPRDMGGMMFTLI
ncbi:MAG: gliding motility protein GldM [Bacteroidetes bacterium]|nr:gliding motility protein GldM [Bacteroidota bacterium]